MFTCPLAIGVKEVFVFGSHYLLFVFVCTFAWLSGALMPLFYSWIQNYVHTHVHILKLTGMWKGLFIYFCFQSYPTTVQGSSCWNSFLFSFVQFGFDFQPTIQKPRIAIISSAGPKPARRCVHFSPPPVFRDLPLQNMWAPNASSFLPPTDRWSHPLIRKRRFAVMMRPHRRPLLPAHPSHGSVDLSPQRQFGCLSDSAINCRRVPGGRGCLDTRLLGILAGFPLTVFNVDRGTWFRFFSTLHLSLWDRRSWRQASAELGSPPGGRMGGWVGPGQAPIAKKA